MDGPLPTFAGINVWPEADIDHIVDLPFGNGDHCLDSLLEVQSSGYRPEI